MIQRRGSAHFDQLNTLRRMVSWGKVSRVGAQPPETHPSFNEHDAIIDPIAGRNPEAAEAAIRPHLLSVAARFDR